MLWMHGGSVWVGPYEYKMPIKNFFITYCGRTRYMYMYLVGAPSKTCTCMYTRA